MTFISNWKTKVRSSCGQVDSVMDLHIIVPGFKTRLVEYSSTELLTDYQHNSIIKLTVRWCVWKVREGFPGRVSPNIWKLVVVYSIVTFHINGLHNDRSAPCVFTVTGWCVMSCVCGMAFMCGSTLLKVPLLLASSIARWPQMLKKGG